MKRPNESELLYVEIPEELDAAILRGVQKGKKIMNRKKYVQRTVAGAAAVFAIFVGSINASPALAANLQDIAVLGTLVRVFQWNQPEAAGGQTDVTAKAAVSFQRNADGEQLTLTFDNANAAAYKANLAHFPETVTLTLPSTQEVAVLEDVNQARENSQFIKSVYVLGRADGASHLQIEFDATADVAVEEYQNPGSIVVRLKEGTFEGKTVYALRTLSMDQTALAQAQKDYPDARILRDDGEGWLLEIGQYDSAQAAEDARKAQTGADSLIVESRFGNNVPAHYATMAEFTDAQTELEYSELLGQSTTIQPILDYLDQHLAQASDSVKDTLLRGLTGFIRDDVSQYDLDALNHYYQMAGQDIHEALAS